MTKYKKEEPKSYPDWGQLHTPKVPKTIEHYFADILWSARAIQTNHLYHEASRIHAKYIINDTLKAWDLIKDD